MHRFGGSYKGCERSRKCGDEREIIVRRQRLLSQHGRFDLADGIEIANFEGNGDTFSAVETPGVEIGQIEKPMEDDARESSDPEIAELFEGLGTFVERNGAQIVFDDPDDFEAAQELPHRRRIGALLF